MGAYVISVLAMTEANSFAESASLWAIRVAMVIMVAVLAAELRGAKPTTRLIGWLWLLGALFALAHSVSALMTFHHGSQEAALESTAAQTEQLLGFRFGAGLYINYLFVVVWLADAAFRLLGPSRYASLPSWYRLLVIGFLVFIAINGAIVFKSGWIRIIGIGCVCMLGILKLTRIPGSVPE